MRAVVVEARGRQLADAPKQTKLGSTGARNRGRWIKPCDLRPVTCDLDRGIRIGHGRENMLHRLLASQGHEGGRRSITLAQARAPEPSDVAGVIAVLRPQPLL